MARKLFRLLAALSISMGAGPLASGAVAHAGLLAGTNLSGNPYFPLVVGATWDYRQASGPSAGTTFSEHVASGHRTASGEDVTMKISSGSGTFLTAQYIVQGNGSIKVVGTSSGGKVSFSGGGDSFIPSAAQVHSCHPCHFALDFVARVATFSIKEHLSETITSLGTQHVTVPAGAFTAQKLQTTVKITGAAYGMTTSSTSNSYLYLVANVGPVETGGGTVTSGVAGHTITSPTGTTELVKYTP